MDSKTSASRSSPARVYLVASLILIAQWVLAWTATLNKSVTFDEIAHVSAGVSYWQRNDYRLQPENGNLPQRWVALPAVVMGTRLTPVHDPSWQTSNVWEIGHEVFYTTPGQDHWPRLAAARGMNALFLAGVSFFVFYWVRKQWDDTTALFTLGIVALDPNFLAHGALATSDMAATLLLPVSLCVYWRHLQSPCWKSRLLSGISLGLACVAKFAAVLLAPTVILLALFHVAAQQPGLRWRRLRMVSADSAAQIAIIMTVIWAFYGFRFSGFHPPQASADAYYHPWATILGDEPSLRKTLLETLVNYKIFPEAFIYGGGYVARFSEYRLAFFHGEVSTTGWVLFFPYLFLVKTPLATLLLLIVAICDFFTRWKNSGLRSPDMRSGLKAAAPLIIWTGTYSAASLATNLNIGHRHLLPLYPALFIFCGAAIYNLRTKPLVQIGLIIMLAAESFLIRPHYIAYFNPLDGGPTKAWQKVVDSSLDWGQDLPETAQWLTENRRDDESVYLAYFGMGDPNYYGIHAIPLQRIPNYGNHVPWHELRGGLYAISSTAMQTQLAVRFQKKDIELYQKLRAKLGTDGHQPDNPAYMAALMSIHHDRLAILYDYLRPKKPEVVIGHSVRIYRLNDAEARALDLGLSP